MGRYRYIFLAGNEPFRLAVVFRQKSQKRIDYVEFYSHLCSALQILISFGLQREYYSLAKRATGIFFYMLVVYP